MRFFTKEKAEKLVEQLNKDAKDNDGQDVWEFKAEEVATNRFKVHVHDEQGKRVGTF